MLRLKCCSSDPIEALAAFFAERGFPAIGFAAFRTSRLKTRPAVVAKDRVKRILGLAFRANHNGNQSQLGRIVPNSFKPGLSVHREGSKQCIVLGYGKSKLDCFSPFGSLTHVTR